MSIPITRDNIRRIKSDTQWAPMPNRGFTYWNGVDNFDPESITASSRAYASKCGRFIREVHTRNEKTEEYYYESDFRLLSEWPEVQHFGDADNEYKTFEELLISICESYEHSKTSPAVPTF